MNLFKEYKIHQLLESNKKLLAEDNQGNDKTKLAKKDASKEKEKKSTAVNQLNHVKPPDGEPEKKLDTPVSAEDLELKFGIKQFVNISEEDMGEVSEKRTLLFPSDGSILDVMKLNCTH